MKRAWFGLQFNCPYCKAVQRKRNQRGQIKHKCNHCKKEMTVIIDKICGLGYIVSEVKK